LLLHKTRTAHQFIGFLVRGLPSLGGSGVGEVFAEQITHTEGQEQSCGNDVWR
jgi:hypothetical protein